MAKLWRH